jgi:multicomponent Na+:H+ antiporter subunit B
MTGIGFLQEHWLDAILLMFMIATAIGVIAVRSVFASVMLMGIFSLLSASLFVVLDAVDVAFTEAAVGAGISVVLFLGALSLIPSPDTPQRTAPIAAFLVCFACGALLIAGTRDMPVYGDPNAPAHRHVAPYYLEQSYKDTGVPNVVTSVLASYRGFDTLGETVVVFTAAIGVLVLLGSGARRRKRSLPPPPEDLFAVPGETGTTPAPQKESRDA